MPQAGPWEKYQNEDGPWTKYQAVDSANGPDDPGVPSLDTPEYTDRDTWGKNKISDDVGEVVQDVKDMGKDALAVGELAMTMATGAVSSISVAAAGAVAQLFGRDPEAVANEVEHYSQFGTYMPISERGQDLLNDVAVPLMKIEENVDDIAWRLARGNPAAATAIKTAVLGTAELLLPSRGSMEALKTGRALRARAAEMKKLAEDLGVNMDQSELAASVVELAHRMTPDQRAQHMPYLQEQMRLASDRVAAKRDIAYEEARSTRTFVDAESASVFASDMRAALTERGFDLDDMPKVNKRLDELSSMAVDPDTGTRVNLSEWDNVRKRLNKNRSADPSENLALDTINRNMGKWLDDEFNRLALNQGSAISGELAGVTAWNKARSASREWHKNFNEDKVISNLISKDATAETVRQWLVGATAMNARKEAASTIDRMKLILGDNHPAIAGIRADFLFEVASPLLHPDGPNFNTFVRNYELMIAKNPSLVKSLDLNAGDFKELHDLARLQKRLPDNDVKIRDVMRTVTQTIARLTVGHEIAKAGVKVNLTRDALNLMIRVNRVTQKQMFYELAGLKYGDVLLPQSKPLAAQFIAGAALTEISDAQKKQIITDE